MIILKYCKCIPKDKAGTNSFDNAEVEALQYLLDNINGNLSPVITTAFWGV